MKGVKNLHISVPVDNEMEFIDATEISPLISHCNVKVCYVSDEPNRNGTVITKDVATEMGKKLPGSPVVGYFNESTEDFEGHNREVTIGGGQFKIVDTTKPYGFVPTDAKVWFQKFADDTGEHEYLVTECYLWTSAYPDVQRVIENGNNQSMELNEKNSSGFWTKTDNSNSGIFIYNEALIEKLCILGENVEPCFEGAQFKTEFSLENLQELRTKMFSMMEELQNTLKEKGGSKPMVSNYAVEIGDTLWCLISEYLFTHYPDKECPYCSEYHIYGIYEEEGQKFVVATNHVQPAKMFRFDLTYDEGVFEIGEPNEVTISFESAFEAKDIEAFETEFAAKKQQEVEANKVAEPAPAAEYNLEEIPEYVELKGKYEALENDYNELQKANATYEETINDYKAQIAELSEFKLAADRKEKQAMIDSFYMLNDEEKKDVVDNIDTYSLDDIEAKLSIICVRNKVNFEVNEPSKPEGLFSLEDNKNDDAPEWVLAVRENAR